MAWSYIKLIQRKNRVSSSKNCNKIFGLLKMRNFRAPDKSGTKDKTRHLRVKNQQCTRGKDNRPVSWGKIVTIPNKKLLSINICPAYCSGCLKFKLLAIIFGIKIQNPYVLNSRG